MPTYKKFTGINNIAPTERLKASELAAALNVDVGLDSELVRRAGFSVLDATAHHNVWEADGGFVLATKGTGDLVNTGTGAILYPALGNTRVWYTDLADGRTTFSNGLICGVTDGATTTAWGVPIPPTLGAVTDVAGGLYPGDYQYALTYVRKSDGLEGGPLYAAPVTLTQGGLTLMGLPQDPDYTINVYLSSHNGEQLFLAGNTATGVFAFTGENADLVLPCRTDFLSPAPVGTVSALWRGHALVAVGDTLYAARFGQPELFDLRRDFKQFPAAITLIQPVDDGVWLGTTEFLCFLQGTEFDKLQFNRVADGRVVLGSGVAVDGERVQKGDATGSGSAMICIVDGILAAGFNGGEIERLTEGRYVTAATEVSAAFREIGGVPQYVAQVLA